MYQYKDHLGNIRLSYKDANKDGTITTSEIVEEKNYYPFGMLHSGYNFAVNGRKHNYGFNGVEHNESLGLNLYEMTFRKYDPAIARWTGIDPVTHHSFSTYNAFDNNPIYWADPSGADGESFITDLFNNSTSGTTWTNTGNGVFSDGNGTTASCDDCNTDPKKGKKGKKKKSQAQLMGEGYARGYAVTGGGFVAAMNGGDPFNPTQADEDEAGDAFMQAVLFVSGEWAAVKVLQGGAWVVRIIKAKNIARNAKFVNLASQSRTAHIIAGEGVGKGGHAWWGSFRSFWNGVTRAKSMFPITWSNNRIMNAVSEVATSNQWIQQTGRAGATHTRNGQLVRYKIEGVYEGVKMRVITTVDEIITAFPIQ